MAEEAKESLLQRCEDSTPRDYRNQMRLLAVLGVWAVAFIGATMTINRELVADGPLLWLVALLPTAVGILVILTYARYLREADELQRVIHYQALALGFGVGWLAVSGYELFERIGLPGLDTGALILPMVFAYTVWILLGRRRYR